MRAQDGSNRLDQGVHSGLGRTVVNLRWSPDLRGDRADAHDPAARFVGDHDAGRFLGRKKYGAEVDVVNAVPTVFGDVKQLEHWADARVVDQNIERTVRLG